MTTPRFLFRFLGGTWLLIGASTLLISIGFVVARQALNGFLVDQLPELSAVFGPLLTKSLSGIQLVAALAFGVFCLSIGLGLVNFQGWARTVSVAVSIALGACLAAETLMLYVQLSTPGLLTAVSPKSSPGGVVVVGGIVSLGLFVAGFYLSVPSAIDAFSGFTPSPPPLPSVKCPTCGGPLDLDGARCPKCDNEQLTSPARAKLIDIQTGQEYVVSTRRETRIGHEPGLEIQLSDRTVSGEHAMVEYVDGHFYLHALKDVNGTYVNDLNHRVGDAEIRHNDLIMFGRAQFRFVVE